MFRIQFRKPHSIYLWIRITSHIRVLKYCGTVINPTVT